MDEVMWRERELRRAAQAEHGKTVIARDEADGEGGAQAPFWGGVAADRRGSADAQLMRSRWNL